jgi:hypothetical protein
MKESRSPVDDGNERHLVLVDLDRIHAYSVLVTAIQIMIARMDTE